LLLFWVLLWSAGTLVADGHLAWKFAQQTRAVRLPTTDGTITRSAVREEPGEDGPTYSFDVAYEYEVAGKRYTGTRYSYDAVRTNTRAWHAVRDSFPVGSRVPVTYNPDDPAESVLHPGPTGFHLMMLWLLTPFNVAMVGGWVYLTRGRRPAFDPTDPRTVVPTAFGWRVRLFDFGAAGVFAGCLLGITFFGTFVWACGFGFNPPVWAATVSYLGAVVVAVLLAALRTTPWLEVDEGAGVLRLQGEPGSSEIPFAAIRSVFVTHEESKDSEGAAVHQYHCDLVRDDVAVAEPPIRLTTYRERDGAEAFVAWLRARVGLPSPPEVPHG
jgi:hypothetical protein